MSNILRDQKQGENEDELALSYENVRTHYNIDNIDLDEDKDDDSSIQSGQYHFQAGSIICPSTFQRILTEVMNKEIDDQKECFDISDLSETSGGDDDYDKRIDNQELFNEAIFDQELERDMQNLSVVIQTNQPTDDMVADRVIEELNQTTDDNDNNDSRESEHDISSIYYGHLNREAIAEEFQFNLESTPTDSNNRFNAKSFAITSWTNVSKGEVMQYIKSEFGVENIQYICISEEISEVNQQQHLHIQIIFKEKINRRRPFLDTITQTHCNYQVTHNDVAWNAYIKKGGQYIEFGSFQSTRLRSTDQRQRLLSPALSTTSVPMHTTVSNIRMVQNRPITVRAQAEERRQQSKEIARQAMKLAETNVHQAMYYIREMMPDKFLQYSSWYLSTFNYIHGRIQQHNRETARITKEYTWPNSFPQCTSQLREVVNRWICHHFSRTKRAKCFILIGPSGTGKTSFALSLPGYVNYFKERWNLDSWHDYARYSVYDDIPWDKFATLNYPNKKGLLTQNGKLNATDKYRRTVEINVRQPAIVLLNPEDSGSLTREPTTCEEQQTAAYWKRRATVYIMSPNEHFYQRGQHNTDSQTNQTSSNSSMATNEERLGDSDEFHI
ncbi:unnamed protein product [Adineta ricciae]|uniref:Replication-associated protein n=1 Tax=Adineta ricciae TaxID=249248 RepID=A0A816BSB7_ADIRI|nr:unnamed protein product [Adineta ricciae]CAF1612772.1 unnamed protein product [Adineta ricciae]